MQLNKIQLQTILKRRDFKIINTDILCSSITDFLKSKNIDIKGKHFEMIKKI